jgi:ribonuclease HI
VTLHIAESKEQAKEGEGADESWVKVFMDGSGYEGQVGAAAVLYQDGTVRSRRRMRLGSIRHHTIYEGEGVGMILGLELIREERHASGTILMGVDNTAAITATHSIKPGPGHYLWDLFHRRLKMVSDRHQDMDLLIRWMPGHIDIEGNEEADKEAKAAAKHRSSPNQKLPSQLQRTLPCSKSAVWQAYHAKLKRAAVKVWQKSPRFEQMKQIYPELPSDKFSKQTSKMLCKHASLLFQL